MKRTIILAALLMFAGETFSATCVKTGSVCADSTPCKTISGVQVCLTDPAVNATCWQYTDTYQCIQPNAVDYCAALQATPGCSQVSSVCAVTDTTFGTGCMQWTNTWRCGAGLSTPANTTSLGTSYTIATDILNNTACATYASNPTCKLAAHTCTDPAAIRLINGLPVYKDCWAWQDSYTCLGTMQSNCAAPQARGCTLNTSKCIQYGSGNSCTLSENIYQCLSSPATTTSTLYCGSQQYCMGGNCFNTGSTPNTDLAQTAAMMEAMRQAGNYQNPATLRIFGGTGGSCTNTLGGLSNCCKPSGGSKSNGGILGNAIVSTGGQVIQYGSSYVYDSLFDNSYLVRGFDSMLGSTPVGSLAGGSASFSPSFGMYGFTATFGAAPEGATVLGSAGGVTFAFDPYSLAIAVAIMVIQDMMSCTPDEQNLSLKLGQNLCRFTGSFCSMEIPIIGGCIQTTQTYCCFNSRLARIINTAGGAQIGKAATDCSGFTSDEFAMLDFSKIDLSEFTNEIMANVKLPSTTAVSGDGAATMQTKLNNYYTRGKQ